MKRLRDATLGLALIGAAGAGGYVGGETFGIPSLPDLWTARESAAPAAPPSNVMDLGQFAVPASGGSTHLLLAEVQAEIGMGGDRQMTPVARARLRHAVLECFFDLSAEGILNPDGIHPEALSVLLRERLADRPDTPVAVRSLFFSRLLIQNRMM